MVAGAVACHRGAGFFVREARKNVVRLHVADVYCCRIEIGFANMFSARF